MKVTDSSTFQLSSQITTGRKVIISEVQGRKGLAHSSCTSIIKVGESMMSDLEEYDFMRQEGSRILTCTLLVYQIGFHVQETASEFGACRAV